MQKGLPPPSGHKQKSQPSGREFASPLHHQLQRTDGNPAPQWPKPRTRGSEVNSDAGKEEPGMIKRASHKRSTPDGSHSCGFTTACAVRRAALPARSRSPYTASHPRMTEANDALAGFLDAFTMAVSSSMLIASAKK